jgi:hypothetical protein
VQLKIQKNKRHPGIPTIRPYGGAYKTMTWALSGIGAGRWNHRDLDEPHQTIRSYSIFIGLTQIRQCQLSADPMLSCSFSPNFNSVTVPFHTV